MIEWQPIETAPRDGTRILVYRKHEDGYEDRRVGIDRFMHKVWWFSRKPMPPTHWMPLPSPPENPK